MLLLGYKNFGQNLVVNGDFSTGNTSFTTTNTYCNTSGCLGPFFNNAYSIGTNPAFFHPLFVGADHTTGTGNMLIVNGGLFADIVWSQSINVLPNTTYSFSAWVCSIYPVNVAPLAFYVNGVSIGSINAPSSLNTWIPFNATWLSGINTTATLSIRCLNTSGSAAASGVDFGIDDIVFHSIAVSSSFLTNTLSLCVGQAFSFTNTSNFATNYSWDFGDGNVSTQTNVAHTYTNSGTYTVQLSAFNGTNIALSTTTILVNPAPSISITPSNYSQCGNNPVLLTASGAVSYTWANGLTTSTLMVTPLTNTVYTILGSAMGCTSSAFASLTIHLTPTLSVINTSICTAETLNLNCNSVSGVSYQWTGPNSFTSSIQNPSILLSSPINNGSYTVLVTSTEGCTNSAVLTASVLPSPSLTLQRSSYTLCSQGFNNSPNTITLTASGASLYSLVIVPQMLNANPLGPVFPLTSIGQNTGITSVTLTGSNGVCTVTTGLTFSIIPNPSVILSPINPSICAGDTYTFNCQGANAYNWSSIPLGSNIYGNSGMVVTQPSVTSVFSVFGSSLGCNSASQSSTITVTPMPQINVSPSIAKVCIGGSIILKASGTANAYTWSPNSALNSINGSTVSANPTSNQTYTVLGSINSCSNIAITTVTVFSLPNPIAEVVRPNVCLNETITLQGFGGDIYQWRSPNNFNYKGQTINFIANSYNFGGIYTLTVVDKNNCEASATTSVNIYKLPDGTLHGTQMKGCVPLKSDFNYYSGLSTSTSIATQWTVDQKVFSAKNFSNEFKIPGNYTIIGSFIDTLTNCINTKTFVVEAYPLPIADFSYLPEKPTENIDEVVFTNTSEGVQFTNWDWYFTNNAGYHSQNKNTSYIYSDAGSYPVAMVVKNKWGCADTVVKEVQVEPDFSIYVPNIFTPNKDGKNEVFLPILRGATSYHMMVFDRWGEQLFETFELSEGWDGSYKGEVCKNGTYIWKITLYINAKGSEKVYSGHVIINR